MAFVPLLSEIDESRRMLSLYLHRPIEAGVLQALRTIAFATGPSNVICNACTLQGVNALRDSWSNNSPNDSHVWNGSRAHCYRAVVQHSGRDIPLFI